MASKGTMDMTKGPLFGKMVVFTIPVIASGILQLMFNMADIIVVGRYAGDVSLAAVGSTSSLVNLFVNIFIGMSMGANVCAAQAFGAKREAEVAKVLQTSLVFGFFGGIVMGGLSIVAAPEILKIMGAPQNVMELATLYIRIFFLGMPALAVYNFMAGILRAVGDTRHPLYFLTISGVINVILNLILVICFDMGVAGVAIATIISQYVSCIMIIIFLMRRDDVLKLSPSDISPDYRTLVRMIRIGLPSGIQGTLFSLSNIVIQSSINSFGEYVIAGSAAASSIENIVYISMNAFQATAVNFSGQNYGAGEKKRVRNIAFLCLAMVTVTGLVLGMGTYCFARQLLKVFTSSEATIQAGITRMGMIGRLYFLCGIMDVMTGMMRGMGRAVLPMLVTLMGACGLRLVWIFTYFAGHHTQEVLYFSYPMSWIVTFLILVLCFGQIYSGWKVNEG